MKALDKMETFLALAEYGSFSETAKRLFCSQPTVTNHIQQLEEKFEATLFIRAGKSVRMTDQGEILQEYAKKMIDLLEEASLCIKNAGLSNPVLSLYASNYMGTYILPDMLAQYYHRLPQQRFELHTHCYTDLIDLLMEEKINMAFLPIYEEDKYVQNQFDSFTLFQDEFVLVLPPDHDWTERKMLYARDIARTALLLPQNSYLQDCILSPIRSLGIKPDTIHMSSFEVIKESIKAGLGAAFIPYYAVRGLLDKGELVTKPVFGLRIERHNGFVRRKCTPLTRIETDFWEYVQGIFRSLRR
ncbi:LysR family transcriptional regulator [Paenibacillus popilliae]|uniref:Transcriptional regulator n=1 Tax=Paenibacillus popilliae ATCC 14706 TaxID=1212764 RepID=M9LBL9_PAEPP|nr:LysR family transcriptional regulator [Paenibacillus popilliae]GAC43267.1 transcriptional regulator [Paenibacillus popilliae ATCC 14706]